MLQFRRLNRSDIPERREQVQPAPVVLASGGDVETVADDLADHIAAADPHSQYLTLTDADARYAVLGPGPNWSAPSGTATRATFASYAGQTVSASPTQAEVQAIDDHVKVLSERLNALTTDLAASGAINT